MAAVTSEAAETAGARIRRGVIANPLRIARIALGTAALAAIVAISLRVAAAAASHASFLVPSGRRTGYPTWMRGPLRHLGESTLPLRSFIVLMTLMALAWLVALACASALPRWVVVTGLLVATAVVTLAPPLLSSDVFNYIAYGRMGVHGIDPYTHGPAAIASDAVYPYTGHLWKHDPSAYGPLFTLISYAFAPLSLAGTFWALKIVTGLASVGCAAFVWLAARRAGRDPAVAATFVALNPLVLVYAVGGAHNDMLMVLFLALALWLALRRAAGLAGASVVTAMAVKLSAGLLLPFLLIGARPRRRALLGTALAAAIAGGVTLAVFGTTPLNMAKVLSQQQHFNWIVVSVPAFVGHYLGLGHVTTETRHLMVGVFAASAVALLARTWAGLGWIEAAAGATFALLVTTGWLLPWYIVWLLPLAALLRRRLLPGVAIALTLLLLGMQLDHFWLTRHSHQHHRLAHHTVAARVVGPVKR